MSKEGCVFIFYIYLHAACRLSEAVLRIQILAIILTFAFLACKGILKPVRGEIQTNNHNTETHFPGLSL